jgi:hypothetical protein
LRVSFRFRRCAVFAFRFFRPRVFRVSRVKDFMTASTAASAAAVAIAVAALKSISLTRATPDLAARAIARWVFRAKLFLAIDISDKGRPR